MKPPEPTDLLRRARGGDQAAFRALYDRYVDRVYALCFRLEPDEALAMELTQDAFIRAWRGLPAFRGDSAFATWLYRLTANVVLSHRRSAARRGARTVVDSVRSERMAAPQAPAGLALDLEQAIAGLPPGARRIFVLHDVEGFRHDEIAELTGLAVGTSKTQLFRARRLLREALER